MRQAKRRRQHVAREPGPRADEGLVQSHPAVAPLAEPISGRVERALQQGGGAAVERVRQWDWRVDPLEAEPVEGQGGEEGRGEGQGVDRGAGIVRIAGQRELGRAEAAAQRGLGLPHHRLHPGLGQRDRGREPIGT